MLSRTNKNLATDKHFLFIGCCPFALLPVSCLMGCCSIGDTLEQMEETGKEEAKSFVWFWGGIWTKATGKAYLLYIGVVLHFNA